MFSRSAAYLRRAAARRHTVLNKPSASMSSMPLKSFDHSPPAYTEAPHPEWRLGEKVSATPEGKEWVEAGKAGFTTIGASEQDQIQWYKLLISGIVPRPIAFVSTVSTSGVTNNPPIIAFAGTDPINPGRLKDSVLNIKNTKGFTVNVISVPFAHNALATAIWELSGLTKEPSTHVKAPRVQESAFSLECELFQTLDIVHPDTGVTTTTLVLGRVLCAHVRNDVLTPKRTVDIARLQPLAALGDISYAPVGAPFRVPRFRWEEDHARIAELAEAGQGQGRGRQSGL
ncbi:hypothetical protein B0H21DRAFT_752741 [Amylocystis lapponica]|nr:hypothetical protein B0H21DRAFT_752741 [Amylocystis lapponica]